MCYKVFLVTDCCQSDDKHWVHGKICWRHYRTHAERCCSTGEWSTWCNNISLDPVTVVHYCQGRVRSEECRVCRIHEFDAHDTQEEREITEQWHVHDQAMAQNRAELDQVQREVAICRNTLEAMIADDDDDDSAEYADEVDRLEVLETSVTYFANAITHHDMQRNELCEHREDLQYQEVIEIAEANEARGNGLDFFFSGHRDPRGSQHQEKSEEVGRIGQSMAEQYPDYFREGDDHGILSSGEIDRWGGDRGASDDYSG